MESNPWKQVTSHVYLYQDTCNVYAVVRDGHAVLIDFGSGAVLDDLAAIGVSQVDAVLHTHHHRDQCQGDLLATQRSIPIWVPEHERRLFDQAELFWAQKQVYDMYNVRNTYFSLTHNVPVAGSLEDFATWSWRGLAFYIQPTPGHSLGSISILVELDGLRLAFTGDLLCGAGQVQTLYDMQYSYGAFDGIEYTVLSLANLARRNPQRLLPSHGEPLDDPQAAIKQTRDNLASYYHLMTRGMPLPDEVDFTPVLPHVLAAQYACSCFYVIISDSGEALLVDFGAPNFSLFGPANTYFEDGERMRFLEHSLDNLERRWGVKKIRAVLPSHHHDDHINGIPYLQQHLGTECWAFENMRPILEDPRRELIGCVLPTPIKVARTFRDGEHLQWGGFNLTIHYAPGHADYHMAMFGEIDGHRLGFSGDNLSVVSGGHPSLIYRNHVHKTSHQQMAELYLRYQPDILCGGHELAQDVKPEIYHNLAHVASEMTRHFSMLLPGEPNYGLEPSWAQLIPYQQSVSPGASFTITLYVNNYSRSVVKAQAHLDVPAGWIVSPAEVALELGAESASDAEFTIAVPEGYTFTYPRLAITADITLDGRRLGQVTEATVSPT
jgi:glyoxylase-like metal-dependent hydrolase (beta-lactamase superfamily II)